eukprot:symbB.v1.2.011403.t2/scaffold764.1/size165801/9
MWLFSGWDQATAPCKPCALANISTDTVRVDVSMLQKEDETQPLTAVQEVWATRFPDFFTQDLQQPVKSGSLQSQGKETPKVPSSLDSQRVPPGVSMHESSETEEELPMSDVASPDAQSCSLAQRRLKGIGPRIKGEAAATMGTALGWLSCADVVLEIFGICHCKGPRKRYKWLQRRQPPRRWGWLSKCWLTWEELRALKMRPPRFDELCSLLQLSKTPVLSRVHVNSPATLGPKLVVSAWIRKDRSPASSKYGGNRGTSRRLKTQARSLIKKLRERESRPGSASEQLETFMKNSLAADEAILQQLGTQGPATTVTIKRTVPSLPRVSAEPPSLRAWRRQWAQPVTADSFQIEAKELTKLKTSLHELQGEVQQLHDLMQEETNEFLHGVSSIKEALQLRRAETRQNSLELTSQKPVPPVPVIKKKVHAGGSGTDVKPLPKALLQRLSRVGQEPEPCSTVTLAQVGQLIIEWLSASSAFSFGSVCCKVALALHTGEGLRIWPHLAVPMWLFREVLWKGVSPNHVRSISVYGATDEVIGQQDLKAALASPSQLKLLRFRCSSRGSEAAIQKRNKHGDSMGLGDDGATVLIAAAQKQDWWSRLSSLDFAWNHLCTSALETLEHSWPAALSSLCLDWNGIGPEGSRFLARALAKPNLLRSLDLRSNPLQDEGVLCICKALASCPLKWLGLGETMLTDNGAELAVKELQGHPCLNGIDLGENSLTDRACTSLAEFIQQTPGLKQLYLRGYLFEPTRISDVGGEVLAQAVSCKEGFELELDYQQVGCKTAAALAKNSLWSRVSLFNTNVSTMGALGLANAFRNGVAQGAGQKWLNVAQCRIAPSAIKLLRSVRVLSRFRHPHLVTLMGFGQREGEKYLVYELMPGGDVEAKLRQSRAWLEKQKQSGVPASLLDGSEAQRLHVALGAAKGLAHMVGSTPKTFHRDIKPANILLDADGTPKMADFGLAAAVKDNGAEDRLAVNEIAGTPGTDYTMLNAVLTACAKQRDQTRADAARASVDTVSFNIVLWQQADGYADEMSYGCMLKACSSSAAAEKAEDWFQKMLSQGLRPNTVVMCSLLNAYAEACDKAGAERWLRDCPKKPVKELIRRLPGAVMIEALARATCLQMICTAFVSHKLLISNEKGILITKCDAGKPDLKKMQALALQAAMPANGKPKNWHQIRQSVDALPNSVEKHALWFALVVGEERWLYGYTDAEQWLRVTHACLKTGGSATLMIGDGDSAVENGCLPMSKSIPQLLVFCYERYTCLSYIDSRHVTEESEVYSLGIVLLELLVNIPPALASNQGDMVFPLLEAVQPYVEGAHGRLMQCLDLGAFWPQQVAEEFGDLALGCLDPKTKRRPSFVVRSLQRLTSLNPRNPRRSMVKIEDPNMLGASSPSDGGTAGSPEGDTQAGGFGGTLITLHAIAAYRACIELRLAWLVAMNTFGCLMKTRNSYLDEEMQDPRSFIQQIQYCMDRVAKDAKSDFKHTLQKAVKTAKEQGYFEPICTQRHLSVRHYTFDVFKYCGDIVHVLALVLCLAVILRDNGTGGISFKTHILYFIVFTARFSNVLFCDQSIYLVLLWSATLKIVLLLYIFGASIDEKDTVSLAAALFMIIVMTLVFGVYSLEDHGLFVEILWIFSTYLESISMLPQYIYCYRDVDNKCPLVSAYVFAMGGYQMVFGVSWAHHFFFRPYELDVSSMISGFLGIVFFCDYLTFRVMGVSMLVQVCISVDDTIKEAEAGFCEICI